MNNTFKSGFVSIIGKPNSGKSTLLNTLVGEKISIVSNKPQTTRNKITGILNNKDYQIIFIDTPGIHMPKTKLDKFMEKEASDSIIDADVIVYLAEPDTKNISSDKKILEKLKNKKIPVILAVNKVDTIKKEKLFEVLKSFSEIMNFEAIVPISALKNDGIDLLLTEITNNLFEGPKYFPDDMITDQPERQIVSEIIREKALKLLQKEVPHGLACSINSMKEEKEGKLIKIEATIFCEKETHKPIIIGKNGEMLKKIGSLSRIDIEKFLGAKVFLSLWVKVKADWRNSDFLLNNFGFKKDNN